MAHRISRGAGRAVVRSALLSTTILGGLCLGAPAAHAVDGTWLLAPATNNWNTATNWSSSAVPDNTANFGASGTTSLTFSANTSINTIQFNTGAPAYSFLVPGVTLNVNGTGIVNNSVNAPTFSAQFSGTNAQITFNNSSSAGNATFTSNPSNFPIYTFNNTSTAANANFQLVDATLVFNNSSNAGNAILNCRTPFIRRISPSIKPARPAIRTSPTSELIPSAPALRFSMRARRAMPRSPTIPTSPLPTAAAS
jgi:hypothetical protein